HRGRRPGWRRSHAGRVVRQHRWSPWHRARTHRARHCCRAYDVHMNRSTLLAASLLASLACAGASGRTALPASAASSLLPGVKPGIIRGPDSALVGEYDVGSAVVFVIEQGGKLWLVDTAKATSRFEQITAGEIARSAMRRRDVGPRAGTNQLQVIPVR